MRASVVLRVFLTLYGDAGKVETGRLDLFHFWRVLEDVGHDLGIAYQEVVERTSAAALRGGMVSVQPPLTLPLYTPN